MDRALKDGLTKTIETEGGPVTPVVCKPSAKCFRLAMEQCGISDPTTVLFLDDSARNLAGAKSLGMTTVLVGRTERCDGADFAIQTLTDLPKVLPGLFPTLEAGRRDLWACCSSPSPTRCSCPPAGRGGRGQGALCRHQHARHSGARSILSAPFL